MSAQPKGISLRDKFARLYGYGHSLTEIARDHNVGRDTVIQLLSALGLKEIHEVFPHAVPEPVRREERINHRHAEPEPGKRPPVICFPDAAPRVWCEQCDRLVTTACAYACSAAFCKAKALAA